MPVEHSFVRTGACSVRPDVVHDLRYFYFNYEPTEHSEIICSNP